MKILITGANGYIGSNLTRLLLDNGYEVVAIDIATDNIDKRARVLNVDIFNQPHIDAADFDLCIHLAWRDGFVHNSTRHIGDLSSHFAFLQGLIDSGLPRLLVMGTMHEVGYHEGMINASTPCHPLSLYAVAKNALRQAVSIYAEAKGCELQWVRGFYIYGDDRKNHSIFTKLIEASERGQASFPFTTGENKYDFMHVDDLVRQIAAVAVQDEYVGIINCCTGRPVSLKDKVEEFIKANHLHIKLDYGAYPSRPYDSPCIYGDSTIIDKIMAKTTIH